jgi:hypothetical protein
MGLEEASLHVYSNYILPFLRSSSTQFLHTVRAVAKKPRRDCPRCNKLCIHICFTSTTLFMVAVMVISPGEFNALKIIQFIKVEDSRLEAYLTGLLHAKIALVQANAHQPRSTPKHSAAEGLARPTALARVDATKITPSFLLYNCMLGDHLWEHPADLPVLLPRTIDRQLFC